ncbi:MAG: sterol desaturase family protein [Pseudomonadota bacterium]
MIVDYLITSVLLSAIIAARYFVVAGFFHWLLWSDGARSVWARRLARRKPNPKLMRHERNWSLVASVIYGFAGGIVIDVFLDGGTALYTGLTAADIWYVPLSIFICLAIHDTWFYWSHRLMHHPKLFPAIHRTHHISHDPTPWAAFSFSPWESLSGAVLLPAVAFVLPLHVGAAVAVLVIMTIASVLNHVGWEVLPDRMIKGVFGRHIITATHHNLHHHDYGVNYGLYFRFWDRVMGTDVMEERYPHLDAKPRAKTGVVAAE